MSEARGTTGSTRREFLRTGGMLAAGMSVAPLSLGVRHHRARSGHQRRGDQHRRPAGGDDRGPARLRDARADVPHAHPGDRSQRSHLALGPGDQSRRGRDRSRARRGAAGQAGARAAPRHPDLAEGQHRHRGQDGDDGRCPGARRRAPARGLDDRAAAPAGGRHHPRQSLDERVGVLQVDPGLERLERAQRPGAQPVRPQSHAVRVELRLGDRGGGEPRDGVDRHRDRRLDRLVPAASTASWASSPPWG